MPWLSRPDLSWPARKARRKRKAATKLAEPVTPTPTAQEVVERPEPEKTIAPAENEVEDVVEDEPVDSQKQIQEEAVPRPETPSTSHPASEENSTNPTTPSSQHASASVAGETTPVPKQRPNGPVVPALPKVIRDAKTTPDKKGESESDTTATAAETSAEVSKPTPDGDKEPVKQEAPAAAPKAWSTPKLWTGLFNPSAANSTAPSSESGLGSTTPAVAKSNAESLAEALRSFNAVTNDSKIAFLKPRGLVNTGNMCYMNSVCTSLFIEVHN